jgi:flagellar protein FlbD
VDDLRREAVLGAVLADRLLADSLKPFGLRSRITRRGAFSSMILVTRFDGSQIILNADLVQWIEQAPHTIITLFGGEKLIVAEPATAIAKKILAYHRAIGDRPRAAARSVLAAEAEEEIAEKEDLLRWIF